jgi:hypothetical protein
MGSRKHLISLTQAKKTQRQSIRQSIRKEQDKDEALEKA